MSLREFIARLREDEDLMDVLYECSPKYEIAAHIRKSCDTGGPALMFLTSTFPKVNVVGGIYGTPERVKRILDSNYNDKYGGSSDLEAVKIYAKCADINEHDSLQDHSIILGDEIPCQEVVFKGDQVDLHKIPICTHNELDNGPFITAGVNVVPWVNKFTIGLGIHRMNLVSVNELSCLAPLNRRVGFPHYKSDEGVKMAVVIGAPPEVVLASQAKVNQRTDKYIIASQLQKAPIKLAKCKTSNIYVPAFAEMILECTSIPNSKWDDTPFAEYPGTYSFRSNSWLCKVDAITHRKDYIYQTILTGKLPQEDSNLCGIPYAAEVYKVASNFVEEVTDIAAFIGNNVFDTIVCIKKNSNSEVENLMHQLLGNKYLKSVTIMDHDLKANDHDWRFAFNTRYQPNRDTIITNLGLGASLDPSSPLFQSTSKIGFDFTVPIGKTFVETHENWLRHRVAREHPDFTVKNLEVKKRRK